MTMKLEQLLVWGLLLMSMKSYAGERYYLSAEYEYPSNWWGHKPRVPAVSIGVEQSGNIFIFNSSFAGETIRIVVANSVLYISVIGKDGIVEIPKNISGEVELQLVRGNIIYHAYVEL